jgi:dihydroflavonol-4-reductase
MKELSLPVVVLNPGTVLGPGDYKPTPSNDFIRLYMKSAPPVYFASGHSYTDVEDVAQGHLLAEQKGEPGRRYVLAGENVSNQDLFAMIDQVMGQRRRRLKVGHLFVSVVGLGVESLARLTGGKPLFTRAKAHKLIDYYGYFSSARAQDELGYRSRPLRQSLLRCREWIEKMGWI